MWAEEIENTGTKQHYKFEQQFAVFKDGVTSATGLTAFRDAQTDKLADNNRSQYLTGVLHEGDTKNIYWGYDVTGSRKVILRKVSGGFEPLEGAKITVYAGGSENAYLDKDTGDRLENLESAESGIFWVGTLPYGTYYLYETTAPDGYAGNKWFTLTVSEDTVSGSRNGITISGPRDTK